MLGRQRADGDEPVPTSHCLGTGPASYAWMVWLLRPVGIWPDHGGVGEGVQCRQVDMFADPGGLGPSRDTTILKAAYSPATQPTGSPPKATGTVPGSPRWDMLPLNA